LLLPAEKSQVTILAADTAVVLRGDILGKPSGPAEAEAMLRRLRNCAHQVYTGLAVLRPGDGAELSDVVATDVYMRDYSDAEIQTYVAGGDPMDKAGAYAIQHADFHPVQNLQGCYANVMGLPVCHLAQMLARFGFQPRHSMIDDCQQAIHHPCPIFIQVMQERQATHW
jgi:MAF protein